MLVGIARAWGCRRALGFVAKIDLPFVVKCSIINISTWTTLSPCTYLVQELSATVRGSVSAKCDTTFKNMFGSSFRVSFGAEVKFCTLYCYYNLQLFPLVCQRRQAGIAKIFALICLTGFFTRGESLAGGADVRRLTLREHRSCYEAEAPPFSVWVLSLFVYLIYF